MFPKIAASSLFAALSVVSVVAGAEFTICKQVNIAIFNKEFKLCSEIQDISCPIPEGKHKFSKCIKVPPEAYPDMTVSVHASARDQNGDTIFCVGKSVTVQE
ncbi:hypothetical protein BGW41_002707 [Actinomortierella wolfii]|nr:hypothetical protein BGW41_002707 [Actinomortierella wolfii]